MTPEPSGSTRRSLLQAGTGVIAGATAGCLSVLDRNAGTGAGWPMRFGDAGHSRRVPTAPFDAPPDESDLAWEYLDESSKATSFPFVSGDTVFVSVEGEDAGIHAVDAHTGERRWRRSLPGGSTGNVSAVHRGMLLVALATGNRRDVATLYALDATDGSTAWTVEGIGSAVGLVHDGRAYARFEGETEYTPDTLAALDIETGEREWSVSDVESSVPTVVGSEVVVGTDDSDEVRGIDPTTGNHQWTLTVGERALLSSDGEHLYAVSETADDRIAVARFDPGDRRRDWRAQLPSERDVIRPAVVGPDRVVVHTRQHLFGLEPETGDHEWTYEVGSDARTLIGGPVLAGNVLLQAVARGLDDTTLKQYGRLDAVDARDGTRLWSSEVLSEDGSYTLCIAHDTLYVRDSGRIRAIRPSE